MLTPAASVQSLRPGALPPGVGNNITYRSRYDEVCQFLHQVPSQTFGIDKLRYIRSANAKGVGH